MISNVNLKGFSLAFHIKRWVTWDKWSRSYICIFHFSHLGPLLLDLPHVQVSHSSKFPYSCLSIFTFCSKCKTQLLTIDKSDKVIVTALEKKKIKAIDNLYSYSSYIDIFWKACHVTCFSNVNYNEIVIPRLIYNNNWFTHQFKNLRKEITA